MPPFRIASLTPEQLSALKDLEIDMGVALVAYEPISEEDRGAMSSLEDDTMILDGLLDTYRTYDPHVIH